MPSWLRRSSRIKHKQQNRRIEIMADGEWIESYVPARLDRMPWSRWHWLIVVALGATWILDGLEVTLAGALGGILTRRETLGLSDAQVGASATFYLAGAVIGDSRAMFAFQQKHAPLGRGVTLDELGGSALYLLSDLSAGVTGEIHFVDSGYNIISMPRTEDLKAASAAEQRAPEAAK